MPALPTFMRTKFYIFFLILALSACQNSALPEKSTENFNSAIRAFYVGLAALQVGDDQRAASELQKASELANGEPAAWNNLGVLQIRQKDFENSAKSLETAKNLAPENAVIYSNLAVLETQRGNFEKAVENLNKAIELNPKDVKSIYTLAREKERANNDAEARKLYERILQEKQGNFAVQLEIARISAKQNDAETLRKIVGEIAQKVENTSAEIKEQFANLQKAANENDAQNASTQVTYLRNVLLRTPEFRSSIAEIQPSDTALGEVLTKPLKLPTPDFSPAEIDSALTFSPQAVAENSKANFAKVIFLNGEKSVIAWSNEKETHIGKAILPVSLSNPNQIIAFDFDYDFKNDLAIATDKGFRLFKQIDGENYEDVTTNTKLSNEILQKSFSGVWTLDVESDGDLDLILGTYKSFLIVLQNNGDGSFQQVNLFPEESGITDVKCADIDEDGDVDCFFFKEAHLVYFYSNERGGLYTQKEFRQEKSPTAGTIATEISDINGDSQIDFIQLLDNGNIFVSSFKNNKWENSELNLTNEEICSRADVTMFDSNGNSKTENKTLRCQVNLISQDFDNNGANDLLISSDKESHFYVSVRKNESQIFLAGKDGKFSPLSNKINLQVSSIAETSGDGKLDLIGVDAEGKPTVFQNKSQKNYHWQILRPKAAKTEGDQRVNTFGIGGEMEIRTGLLAQKQLINSPQVHFGLGENESADVLRVVWGNGYVQAEFDLKADQTIAAEQRLKGSCPHLFTWNGSEFVMVKDAPPWSPALGLKINAQDTYGVLQTEEWFKIPGENLKPKDGFYELRITGEYWESFYLDNYKLLVVDHPETTEVFTDERFAIPLPPLKVFTTELSKEFASAKDQNGKDVAEIVGNLDEKYLDSAKRGKFQGVAETHFAELELPENAPKDKKIWIIADGFVHPTDASINVQLGQSSLEKPKSLSLEVLQENGEWKVEKENLGFPAGKMKTVLIELPQNAQKFRLKTNMEIFWDKLAWAVDLPENQTKEIPLELNSAELRYRGFSVIEKADDSSPEKPVYNKILTTNQRWRDLEGFYTRFGDVLELLQKTDDRMVLMNAGDELVLKFPALPEVEKGWKRDFVIIGNGWIKDGDLNSVFSKTLLPLPTHATNDYTTPPNGLENDPVYQKHKEDWLKFHTRYVSTDNFRNALR